MTFLAGAVRVEEPGLAATAFSLDNSLESFVRTC
jgi:hypothetical protein